MTDAKTRLEELRATLRAEDISYGELSELQGLVDYIEPGDVELLEWAGVPEFPDDELADETVSGDAVDDGAITGLGA
jgi:hypothetical protein